MKELIFIQSELKVPKNQFNGFGKYSYRSCEDILESVKPLLTKSGCTLIISDEVILVGDRIYIKAIAIIKNPTGQTETATAFAREPEIQKGMSDSQLTGSASSYARKYALNGLFCIDDNKDADTQDNSINAPSQENHIQQQHGSKRDGISVTGNSTEQECLDFINSQPWPDAKKDAMGKRVGDPFFRAKIMNGEIK